MITKYEKCINCGFNTFKKDDPSTEDFADFIQYGGPDGCYECAKGKETDET